MITIYQMEKDGTMKYNNKLELIDAIKSNADLFIREYYAIALKKHK